MIPLNLPAKLLKLKICEIVNAYSDIEFEKGSKFIITSYMEEYCIVCELNATEKEKFLTPDDFLSVNVSGTPLLEATLEQLFDITTDFVYRNRVDTLILNAEIEGQLLLSIKASNCDIDGIFSGIYAFTNDKTEQSILCSLARGMKQSEIARNVGCSQALVSGVKQRYFSYLERQKDNAIDNLRDLPAKILYLYRNSPESMKEIPENKITELCNQLLSLISALENAKFTSKGDEIDVRNNPK